MVRGLTRTLYRICLTDFTGRKRRAAVNQGVMVLAWQLPERSLMPMVVRLRARFPQIAEPGGGLYPPERAEACWRDFWHYLRPITYGLAGENSDYLSVEGLENMRLLYQELQVPLDAMTVGLSGLKIASLNRIDPSQHAIVTPYFDRLITQLQSFSASHE